MSWSETRLTTAEQCGLRYHLKYVENLPDPPGEAAEVGSLVHEIMAEYARHCLTERVEADESALREIAQRRAVEPVFADAWAILEPAGGHVRFSVAQKGSPWGVEERLAFAKDGTGAWERCAWEDSRAWWRAIVDLYYLDEQEQGTVLVVRDWKTQAVLPSQAAIERDQQLRRYAYCLSLLYPEVEHIYAELVFLRYGVARHRKLTTEELQEVPQEIERRVKRVEELGPEARVSSACDWCNFTARCPAYQQAREFRPEPIRDSAQAEQAAQAYLLLKRRLGDLERQLKAWAGERGSITVGDVEVGYADEAQNECLDPRAAFQFLVENLIPQDISEQEYESLLTAVWEEAVSLSPSSAERAIKRLLGSTRDRQVKARVEGIKAGLQPFFQDLRKSVFRARKLSV